MCILEDVRPLESLQHLRLGGRTPCRLISDLRAPNLEHLYVASYVHDQIVARGSAVHFPNLRVLEVSNTYLQSIAPFLSTHPGIRSLSLDLVHPQQIELSIRFGTKMELAFPHLTTLYTPILHQHTIPLFDGFLRRLLSSKPDSNSFTLKVPSQTPIEFVEGLMGKYAGHVELTDEVCGDIWDSWDELW